MTGRKRKVRGGRWSGRGRGRGRKQSIDFSGAQQQQQPHQQPPPTRADGSGPSEPPRSQVPARYITLEDMYMQHTLDVITESYCTGIRGPSTCFCGIPPKYLQYWWNQFKVAFTWDPMLTGEICSLWYDRLKESYNEWMASLRGKMRKPSIISSEDWAEMLRRWSDPCYNELCEQNHTNWNSENARNTDEYRGGGEPDTTSMNEQYEKEPKMLKVFKKAQKKKGTNKWCDSWSEAARHLYSESCSQQEAQDGTRVALSAHIMREELDKLKEEVQNVKSVVNYLYQVVCQYLPVNLVDPFPPLRAAAPGTSDVSSSAPAIAPPPGAPLGGECDDFLSDSEHHQDDV